MSGPAPAGPGRVTSSTASITVAIGTNPGGGTLGGTTTVAAVNGVATFSTLSINRTGTGYTLTASSTGLGGDISATFNVTPAAAAALQFTTQPSTTASTVAIAPAVQVTVVDQFGNPVPTSTASITVAIGTNPSGGTLTGTRTVSAVNGVASFSTLSIERAGTGYTLTASSTGLTGATSSTFDITVGAATRLVFSRQPTTTVAGASISPSVQVTVQDAGGNTVTTSTATITLALDANPGGGTLSGTLINDAVNGVATFSNLSINRAGTGYSFTAASSGLNGATSTAFTIVPGAPTQLLVSAPATATAGVGLSATVTAQDALGNTVTSYGGTIHFTSTDAQALLPSDYTFIAGDNGTHTFTNGVTLGAAGSQTITATDVTASSITGTSGTIAVSPAAAVRLVVAGYPSSTTAGTSETFTVTALDAYGNTASGYAGTVHFSSSDGQATLSANATLSNGTGTFSATLRTAGTQSITATDSVTSSISGTQNGITVSPLIVSRLAVVPSASVTTAGTPLDVTVTAQDQFGNTIANYAGTVAFSSTDGQATLPAEYTFSAADNGTHAFSNGVILRLAGSQTVSARDTILGPLTIAGTSNPIDVGSAPAETLLVVASTGTTAAGSPLGVTVTARDQFGNTASSYSGTVHFTSSDAQAVLPSNYTFVASDNGTHTFSNGVILRTAGSQTVSASDTVSSGLAASTNPITVDAAAASRLVVVPSTTVTTAGSALDVLVTVQDQFGNTVSGYSGAVHFTSSDSQALLPVDYTFVAGDSGTHAFASGLTVRTAGSQTVTATDVTAGSISGTSNPISVSASAASSLQVVPSTGSTTAGNPVGVTVTARDQFGNAVTGYTGTIHFTSTDAQGTLPFDYSFSAGDNGAHIFPNAVTLRTAGNQTVTATDAITGTITGTTNPIAVGAATVSQLVYVQQPTNTAASSSINPAVTLQVRDSFGNLISGASVTIAIGTNPAGGTLSGTTTASSVNGVATFSNLSINRAGTGYTLTASTTGAPATSSAAFSIVPGPASRLVFTNQPTTTLAGSTINGVTGIWVTIQDAGGNTVTSSTAPITVAFGNNPTGATLTGSTTVSAVNGTATFNLSISRAGTGYTLVATSGALTGATSNSFDITVGAAQRLALIVQPSNTARTATMTPAVQVAVQDQFGNTVTSSTAAIALAIGTNPGSGGGGTLTGGGAVNAVNGVATFSNLSINRTGTGYTLVASSGTLTSVTSDPFNIT